MNYLLGIIGTWLLTDSIYSITLYLNAPSYDGSPKQTFRKDHWVRIVRAILAISIIIMGWNGGI